MQTKKKLLTYKGVKLGERDFPPIVFSLHDNRYGVSTILALGDSGTEHEHQKYRGQQEEPEVSLNLLHSDIDHFHILPISVLPFHQITVQILIYGHPFLCSLGTVLF